ncbi:Hard surface-induced protein [Colletotrichum higginsianum IMI 349063]|uniref:Hard surface-induced protein n=2 Tax=Colletotrichum higginsianum TaxID=80884 RepID=A0A1B7YWB1_COLHI|nr:Hard surface-induced protein [Colletotrichum higginsianum IMI 349063]OBR16320.1 Hard surface-induced protein [Colletotrichum higginsianum IMI 349063]TID04757.1 hypothetical protein CH35J_001979 [Colletotrichum higginsianum]
MERFLHFVSNPLQPYSALTHEEDGGDTLGEEEVEKLPPTTRRGALVRGVLWSLLPSFISRPIRRHTDPNFTEEEDDGAIPDPNSTSYLNGLRGIASLIVACQHNTNQYFPANNMGWGDPPGHYHIIQLPFVRTLLSGSFSVTVFFVISGFALSYGPLKKMHQGRADDAIGNIPSSLFRRPLRLFLPVLPVLVFTNLVLIHWFNAFYAMDSESLLPPQTTVWDELCQTWRDIIAVVIGAFPPAAMPQVWTLGAEYQGSLVIFLCCLAFSRVGPATRMSFVTAVFCWQWHVGYWQTGLFLAGMVLADLRLLRPGLPSLRRGTKMVLAAANWFMLFMALWLGGWPIYGEGGSTLGFTYFDWIPTGNVPQNRFWHGVSAIALVSSLENMAGGRLQSWLNARWVLYLGEISYGLYLVHWMIAMNSLTKGTVLQLRLEPGWSDLTAWMVGFAVSMPLCIWVADLHWRLVDKRSVKLARRLSDFFGI